MAELDRGKLTKLLSLLSSNHDGEVLNAGRKASRLVKQAGLSWETLLGQPPKPTTTTVTAVEPDQDLLEKIEGCLDFPEHLHANEFGFLEGVREWVENGGEPSPKQMNWLNKILRRIERLEGEPVHG